MTERTTARTRRRRDPRREGGQVLVIFALALVSMLAMAGLLIDGGRAGSDRRIAQNAADTAALAAAKAISVGDGTYAARARDVGAANGYPKDLTPCTGATQTNKGVEVYYPPITGAHIGDSKFVEVVVSRRMSTTFSAVIGQGCWLVSARAVAQTVPTFPTGPAIFAMDTACGGGGVGTLAWKGADIVVHGDVVSNGGIDWSGSGGGVDPGNLFTYRDPAPVGDGDCDYKPHTNTAAPNQAVPVSTILPDPFTYTTADFTCTNGSPLPSKLELPASGTLIPDGTYCATDSITIKVAGARCNACTLIAPKIQISGADVYLRPREHGVLMWGTGTGDAINWSGANGDWAGIVYAPNGDAHISGCCGNTIAGAIWAKTVELPGGGWSITPPSAGSGSAGVVKLVE